MYTLAGVTGRVGSAAAHALLEDGAQVRVLVRKPADAQQWVDRGAAVLNVVVDGEAGHILLVETDGEDWFDLRWSRNYASEVRAMVETIQRLAAPAVINVEVI